RYQVNRYVVPFIEPYEIPEPVVTEADAYSDQNGQGDPGARMLTRAMAKELSATSAQECLFVGFLTEKNLRRSLRHLSILDGLMQYKRNLINLLETMSGHRLVAQGYNQQEGIDYNEAFSLVARLKAIRIFLAFATYMNFIIKQSERGILINQENYVKDLLKKYDINGSLVKTPMVPPNNLGPDRNGKAVNETQYIGMIRSLMYLTAIRPGIQFSTCLCVRQQANLKESHHIAVKRNFRYLKAMSSSEAKYVAAGGCCANILWMKSQLSDYDIVYEKVPIFCDNTSAITFSNNLVLHSRTKHIDIRYHFIIYHIMKGDIELHFIPTQYQLSDIFNKPLEEPTFKRLIVELGMLNIDNLKPESSKNFENES
ncbi:retrovirus-related pol polyprotein from transposon TNT 1-94, partial [Tanacetum coccineum]